MKIVHSPLHVLHWLKSQFSAGEYQPCFETPERVEIILDRIRELSFGEVIECEQFSLDKILRVHKSDYVEFLQSCWDEWANTIGSDRDAIASVFGRVNSSVNRPSHIEAKLGYYSGDLTAGLGEKSWHAIKASADVALTAADLVLRGERAAFALCRPAGHHACASRMAGYCYVNNVAVAAQHCIDSGCAKVAILDIDYHHGNGTQSIFYDRSDVFTLSIHADPSEEYPFFEGYQDEIGEQQGKGLNLNLSLPLGTVGWKEYLSSLDVCLHNISQYKPDILLISLGVDTYEHDPISSFKLKSEDFLSLGERIESANLPTLFAFEGGYATKQIGINTMNVITAFEDGVNQRTHKSAQG